MLKCNEIIDNSKDCDTFADFICRLIIQLAVNTFCEDALEFLSDPDMFLPATHPRVRIELRNTTQDYSIIADIEDRTLVFVSGPSPPPPNNGGDELVYFVDGVECFRCNVGSTPVVPGVTPGAPPAFFP